MRQKIELKLKMLGLMILLWFTILCDAMMDNSNKLSDEYNKEKSIESDVNHQWQSTVVRALCPHLFPKMIELVLAYISAPLIATEFTAGINCIGWSFSRDHVFLYTVNKHYVDGKDALHVWSTITGYHERTIVFPEIDHQSVSFSPNNSILALGDDKTVILWNTDTGKRIHIFDGFPFPPQKLIFDEQGQYLVIVCYSLSINRRGGQIFIKDLATGSGIITFSLPPVKVLKIQIRPLSSQTLTGVIEIPNAEREKLLVCTMNLDSTTMTTKYLPLIDPLYQFGILTHDGQYYLRCVADHIQSVELATGIVTSSRVKVDRGMLVAVSPDRAARWVAVAWIYLDKYFYENDDRDDYMVIETVEVTVWDIITQLRIRQIIRTYRYMSNCSPRAHLAKYAFTNDLAYFVVNYLDEKDYHHIRAYKLV